MSDLIDKISSYNIFNYLLPGILFAAVADRYSSYSFIHEEVVISLFVYYFIGMVISRIGSLLFEPMVRKLKFVQYCDYGKFLAASKNDAKIETLSEEDRRRRGVAEYRYSVCSPPRQR